MENLRALGTILPIQEQGVCIVLSLVIAVVSYEPRKFVPGTLRKGNVNKSF